MFFQLIAEKFCASPKLDEWNSFGRDTLYWYNVGKVSSLPGGNYMQNFCVKCSDGVNYSILYTINIENAKEKKSEIKKELSKFEYKCSADDELSKIVYVVECEKKSKYVFDVEIRFESFEDITWGMVDEAEFPYLDEDSEDEEENDED